MAQYFGRAAADLLAAGDITDESRVAVMLSGSDNGPLLLSEARKAIVTVGQTALPAASGELLLGSIQTGASKGLYINNGSGWQLIVAYTSDGTWPV